MMNKIAVNVAEVGNHEFDYGIQVLKLRMEQARFKRICANVDMQNSGTPQSAEYFTIDAAFKFPGRRLQNLCTVSITHSATDLNVAQHRWWHRKRFFAAFLITSSRKWHPVPVEYRWRPYHFFV